ncbi:MAG: ATP-binding cassette domain-containing protein [Gammaproteobacteria bacterium]|nr:ATP-binding cassette domain-containing protein [Gammaproteobacteria bacterium]
MNSATPPLIEFRNVSKFFGSVIALQEVSFSVEAGGVSCCLLGDNGAGKSTLIKTLAGVHKPSGGEILLEGEVVEFDSPRDALDAGIATVYQDLALVSLMSVTRNFFMGREPLRRVCGINIFDVRRASQIAREKMAEVGINIRDPNQAVGTMSGGERQCLAIARAIYFGAKVLILDEPTAALGVKQSGIVLKMVAQARARGIGVILITHNVHHAYPIGDKFAILNRGRQIYYKDKKDASREEVLSMMAGGREWRELEFELKEFDHADGAKAKKKTARQVAGHDGRGERI